MSAGDVKLAGLVFVCEIDTGSLLFAVRCENDNEWARGCERICPCSDGYANSKLSCL